MKRTRIGAAEAKTHLSELLSKVAYGGESFVIERRGRPVAALVGVTELEKQGKEEKAGDWQGFLCLVGAWKEAPEAELDDLVAHIYEERLKDLGRSVDLKD